MLLFREVDLLTLTCCAAYAVIQVIGIRLVTDDTTAYREESE